MKARKTEKFYVEVFSHWQVKVSRKEFFDLKLGIESIERFLHGGKIPCEYHIMKSSLPGGSFMIQHFLVKCDSPYPPTSSGCRTLVYEDGYITERR